jgi:hypothetical protein
MVVLTWVTKAIKGDPRFLSLLLDRIEGKLKATVELTGGESSPVIVRIVADEVDDPDDGGAGSHWLPGAPD